MHAPQQTPRINEKWRGRFAYLCRQSAPRAVATAGYELSARIAARRIGKIDGVTRVDWVGRGVKDCHPGLSDIDLRITLSGCGGIKFFERLTLLRKCVLRLRAEMPWLGEVTLVNPASPHFLREINHGVLWDRRHSRQLFPQSSESEESLPDEMSACRLGHAFSQYRLASLLFSHAFENQQERTLAGQRCRRLLEKVFIILGGSPPPPELRSLELPCLHDAVLATFHEAASALTVLPKTSRVVSGKLLKLSVELQVAHESARSSLRKGVHDLEDTGLLGIFATEDAQAGSKSVEWLKLSQYFPVAFVPFSMVCLLQNGWGSFSARSFLFRTDADQQSDFSFSRAWVSLLHRLALWESVWWGRWISEPKEKLEMVWRQAVLVRTQLAEQLFFPERPMTPSKNPTLLSEWHEEHLKMRETLRRELAFCTQ